MRRYAFNQNHELSQVKKYTKRRYWREDEL